MVETSPLPPRSNAPSPTSPPAPASAAPARRPLRVLYADDMKELRDLLKIVLGKEGHVVDTVSDGTLAHELLAADPHAYDLLITDHHMVDMNGLELVQRVRQMAFAGKILVFSSELSQEVTAAYHRLAVDQVIHKPIFPAALRQLIAELYAPKA
jgi:two-component system, chemotaxis family, chemotaxis protein CheY